MSAIKEAGYAANWLEGFFECSASIYSRANVPIDTIVSVIILPYGERWRVRLAWLLYTDEVHVHVSNCPTGEVTLNIKVKEWRDAVPAISNAIHEWETA